MTQRSDLEVKFLSDITDDDLRRLHDTWNTLGAYITYFVNEYQLDLAHDVFAAEFFDDVSIAIAMQIDPLPNGYARNDEDDEDEDDYDE